MLSHCLSFCAIYRICFLSFYAIYPSMLSTNMLTVLLWYQYPPPPSSPLPSSHLRTPHPPHLYTPPRGVKEGNADVTNESVDPILSYSTIHPFLSRRLVTSHHITALHGYGYDPIYPIPPHLTHTLYPPYPPHPIPSHPTPSHPYTPSANDMEIAVGFCWY